jgi:catechol 2,3-dioxygenase-like lactoylglutathione lyase family enzyme
MVRVKEAKGLLHRVWVVRVFVSDQEAAIAFFRDVLELPVVLYAPQFKWVELGPPDERAKIALVEPDPEAAPEIFEWQRAQIGSSTSIVFETKNIDALFDRLRERGVRFPVPPQEMPWGGVMAVFEDLDGNRYQVVEDPDHYKRDYGEGGD